MVREGEEEYDWEEEKELEEEEALMDPICCFVGSTGGSHQWVKREGFLGLWAPALQSRQMPLSMPNVTTYYRVFAASVSELAHAHTTSPIPSHRTHLFEHVPSVSPPS